MRLNFLCQGHRNWLLHNPDAAASTWFNHHEQAVVLREEANMQRATAYAGCAMEAADIAMDHRSSPKPSLIDQYTRTSLLLVELLSHCREAPTARAVVDRAIQRLEALLLCGGDKDCLLRNCDHLLAMSNAIEARLPTTTSWTGATASVPAHTLH